jgi:hypothetical protein
MSLAVRIVVAASVFVVGIVLANCLCVAADIPPAFAVLVGMPVGVIATMVFLLLPEGEGR